METNLLSRITINPEICHGKPIIRNMRYPVELILDLLSSGMTNDEILKDYPSLQQDDILACLAYASKLTKIKSYSSITSWGFWWMLNCPKGLLTYSITWDLTKFTQIICLKKTAAPIKKYGRSQILKDESSSQKITTSIMHTWVLGGQKNSFLLRLAISQTKCSSVLFKPGFTRLWNCLKPVILLKYPIQK